MKKLEQEVRKKMVVIRMNAEEYLEVEGLRKKTTERHLGTYLRKLALQKPVFVKYRNQSADDFLQSMVELKKELNAIGNNFNQAVHKLHLLETIPEFREWIKNYGSLHERFVQTTNSISNRVKELYERWLQK